MRKLVTTFMVLAAFFATSTVAFAQEPEQTQEQEQNLLEVQQAAKPYKVYCEIVATPKLFSNKATVELDFGQYASFWSADRQLVDEENVPVLCFGLRTDFQTRLFPGSRRLFELADSITEIKTICECGSKATVNARIGADGRIVTQGAQVMLGGNDSYVAMCHACWRRRIAREAAERGQTKLPLE